MSTKVQLGRSWFGILEENELVVAEEGYDK